MAHYENLELLSAYVNPELCLNVTDSRFRVKSNSIVGSETDPYKKLALINQWVAMNITYDKAGSNDPSVVLTNGRGSGKGISKLMEQMIRAQNIPCFTVDCYTFLNTDDEPEDLWRAENVNHAFVQAYLESEDRWVNLDPSFDAVSGVYLGRFFDVDPGFLCFTHKVLSRKG